MTGIATAYMDSVPMVAITGQVATTKLGTDAFQEADITGVTLPVVKHSYLVKDAASIPAIVREAFAIALSGRPGPVVIDLPVDLSFAQTEYIRPQDHELRGYHPDIVGDPLQIEKIVSMIDSAKHPLLIAGGGVIAAGASEQLLQLSESASIPVNSASAAHVRPAGSNIPYASN